MHLYFALVSPEFREQKDNLAMKTSNFFLQAIWEFYGLSFKNSTFFQSVSESFSRKFPFDLI